MIFHLPTPEEAGEEMHNASGQGHRQGGSWGAHDPLLQAFFNQTTYNRWRKCHNNILAIAKKPFFLTFDTV